MKALYGISFVLVIVGGLNWLLVGLFNWDVGVIFGGQGAFISKIIYILVGLSALYLIVSHKKYCKDCCKVSEPVNNPTM
jgi:hypothetical protein